MERQIANHYRQGAETGVINLRLLQVAGGDTAFAEKLRELMWQMYSEAGLPMGVSEEGMYAWWTHTQALSL